MVVQISYCKAKRLTWYHVTRIHGILVLDEAEAIHELDLHDLPGTMGVEVILDIGLGSYIRSSQLCQNPTRSLMPENASTSSAIRNRAFLDSTQ